ncbi:uncharacterized protein [Venturia canescens]|uniref:uncharacterized protein n=1 Tax=Venturia canescens TaxID=32260 RepID=UPI001C9BD854|nr:uncharacterized protein LOC122418097 [Venturia canescens]
MCNSNWANRGNKKQEEKGCWNEMEELKYLIGAIDCLKCPHVPPPPSCSVMLPPRIQEVPCIMQPRRPPCPVPPPCCPPIAPGPCCPCPLPKAKPPEQQRKRRPPTPPKCCPPCNPLPCYASKSSRSFRTVISEGNVPLDSFFKVFSTLDKKFWLFLFCLSRNLINCKKLTMLKKNVVGLKMMELVERIIDFSIFFSIV